ncbi:MAG: peptide ABC transporter permease, partial [Rhodospirillales bacterium]|nr:peptide ABC transporter permease [Rhodospirillales bacterium]
MLRFFITRFGLLIPTFLGVTVVAFSFIRLIPGDPIEVMVGERGIDPERHAYLLAEFGYDKPLWQQYLVYLGNLLQGDMGKSVVTKQPVLAEFFTLFPATVELGTCAIVMAVAIGLP